MIPQTKYGKITLAAVVIQAIIVIILESYVAALFVKSFPNGFEQNSSERGIPVYLIIFIASQVFQIVLCWDAVWHQNTIQIIGFVIFNACVCAYSLFQYFQLKGIVDDAKVALILIPIITGTFVLFFCFLAFKLYLEFGWKIYKKIGADPKMRNMYRAYQIFLMLLKLDFFFFIAFSAQFLYLVLEPSDPEFGLTIAAIPITGLIVILAVYGVRREDKWIMGVFIVGLLVAIAYFIFKLVRMYQPSQEAKYQGSRRYLTFFSSITLICVILTLGTAVVCYRNFSKGLKTHLFNTQTANSNQQQPEMVEEGRRPLE